MRDQLDYRPVQDEERRTHHPVALSALRSSGRRRRVASLRVASAIALALVLFSQGAASSASRWHYSIRLPWYGTPHFQSPTACGQLYTRWTVGVAVRPGTGWRCGDRVELRHYGRSVVAQVMDTFSPSAPDWVVFDASARIGCALLNPKRLKPKPGRALGTCYTRDDVDWRLVKRGNGRSL